MVSAPGDGPVEGRTHPVRPGEGGEDTPRGAEGGRVPVENPRGAKLVVPQVGYGRGRDSITSGSFCPVCGARSRRLREHVTGHYLPPVFRSTVPRDEFVLELRYRALRWLAETLLAVRVSPSDLAALFTVQEVFGPSLRYPWFTADMVAFCNSVGGRYSSVWPLHGKLHTAMLLHWRVQCANEVVAGRRLAEYPNRVPASSASPSAAEGSLRGRRMFAVVSDPRYASGCPIPREPHWDLDCRDPFPHTPEATASLGVPKMPGGGEDWVEVTERYLPRQFAPVSDH
jgi:hypothetical protein